jgi:hypothetical protein
MGPQQDSIWRLRFHLLTAKALVWAAQFGRNLDLTSETHLYFFDCYQQLANYHERRGHQQKAARLARKAREHYRLGGGDGPPYAAAMGMPRPRHWIRVDAVSGAVSRDPDDAA